MTVHHTRPGGRWSIRRAVIHLPLGLRTWRYCWRAGGEKGRSDWRVVARLRAIKALRRVGG